MPVRVDPIFLGGDEQARWAWAYDGDGGSLSGFNYAQPFHLLLAEVAAAASVASGEAVTLTWDSTTGDIVASPEGFLVSLLSSEALSWSVRAVVPPSMLIGYNLPVLVLPREAASGRYPVLYPGTEHYALDCRLVGDYSQGELSVNPASEPHVLYRGNDEPWSLDELDGWVALRPVDQSVSGAAASSTRTVTTNYRCVLIGDVEP